MASRLKKTVPFFSLVLGASLLSSCALLPVNPEIAGTSSSVDTQARQTPPPVLSASPTNTDTDAEFTSTVTESVAEINTLSFTDIGERNTPTTSRSTNNSNERSDITLNLVGVPAQEAIHQVFAIALRANYVVETPLNGNLTIQTATPVNERQAIALLTNALGAANATIIADDGFYRVVARNRAGNSDTSRSSDQTRFVYLDFISAQRMQTMLSGLNNTGVTSQLDTERNLLILRGDPSALNNVEDLIQMFDVNWMRGMSFSATPVVHTSAVKLVEDLNSVFSATSGGALEGVVRFIPIKRLNVILTVTPQADYLKQASVWIDRLDRSGGASGERLYVLQIENRPAIEIAEILRETLSAGTGRSASSGSFGIQPGQGEVTVFSEGEEDFSAGPTFDNAQSRSARTGVKILADEANNAIVIHTTPEQFSLVEDAVKRLDIAPNQVFLEATIAEVTLNDDLSFGLSWFFQSGEFETAFSTVSSGAVASTFPGFNVLFAGSDARAALTAVAGVTDVDVLSAPSLMVLDNRTATLQVGDQVPIVTQSSVSVTDSNAPIVNSVSLRDTGIILNVTPRVNEGGLVMLEIDQEVSDVVSTQSSGIDSPTIQQRRISTSIAVRDGESVALGGLIRERKTNTKTKVPFLGDLPLIGNAFSERTSRSERTELLVLITPRVITGARNAAIVTDDFRRRMQEVEALIASSQDSGM